MATREIDAALVMLEALPARRRGHRRGRQGVRRRRGSSTSVGTWASRRTSRRRPTVRSTRGRPAIAGYGVSQRRRKRVEEIFGWMKTTGLLRKLRHRGGPLVAWIFTFTAAAYNLVRLRTLLMAPA